jgi:hypothetical protein
MTTYTSSRAGIGAALLRVTLLLQGSWYLATAVWSLAHITSFLAVTGYPVDPFKTQTNGVLFLVLGWYLLRSGWRVPDIHAAEFGFAAALGVALVEAAYLPHLGDPAGFWVDAAAEFVLAFAYLVGLVLVRFRI